MTLEQFKNACGFDSLLEVEKVCHLAFFHLKTKNVQEFSPAKAAQWLSDSGGASPNRTRLEGRLRADRNTIKGQSGFKLKGEYVRNLETKYHTVAEKSQEVIDQGTILPEIDYKNTRGFIADIVKQINASYEHNLFDSCAVLMRRLVEILLILSYRHLHIENLIKDGSGNYFMLEGIINNANTNSTLGLSRNTKTSLETFRQLGNFSAHKIEYTCRREYIRDEIQNFRALIVELLHKCGLRS